MAENRTTRIIVVHGWMGTPTTDWMPWIKKMLTGKGVKVIVPKMPDTEHPNIDAWLSHLSKTIGKPDSNTFLIGHSIGGNAILRYIQALPVGQKIGGAIIVASWINRRKGRFASKARRQMMLPWFKEPIYWNKILKHTRNFIAVYSDNDPYVPRSAAQLLQKRLGAKVVIAHYKWHFNMSKYPIILEGALAMIKAGKQKD
ncbi:MAG: RBBP9/YdeN family alpha/beta hydrolase [Candidatus Micrarchaeales archaeon]